MLPNPSKSTPSRQPRPLMMEGANDMQTALEWMGPGGEGDGVPNGQAQHGVVPGQPGLPNKPEKKEKKEKRPPGFKKITQNKIQQCNTKLTDLKCWQQKVSASPLQLIFHCSRSIHIYIMLSLGLITTYFNPIVLYCSTILVRAYKFAKMAH